MRRVDILDLLAGAADGVAVLDRHLRFVFWNKTAEQLLGFTAEEVIGRYCYEVFAGRDACGSAVCQVSCFAFVTGRAGKQVPTSEVLVSTKGGGRIWINLSTLLVRSKKRRDLSSIVHLFRGVHTAVRAERVVEDASRTLAQQADRPEARAASRTGSLTARENEVLQHLVSGATTKAIADRLYISPLTVRNHIRSVLAKLGVHTRLEAVIVAMRRDRSDPS